MSEDPMSEDTGETRATLDVATILQQLRAEVRAQHAALGTAADPALHALERELQHCAEQLELTRVVSAHWPLEGHTLYERAWAFVNKLVRHGLRWYINPIVAQQNAFNDLAARSLRLLIEGHAELRRELVALQRARGDPSPGDSSARAGNTAANARPTTAATSAAELQALTKLLAAQQTVSAHWPLGGATARARAGALAQRGVRQYLRWLINPIVEQQNAFNAALAASLPPLHAAERDLHTRLASKDEG